MRELHVRQHGKAGRITLTRPQALNALTHAMLTGIEAALAQWRDDPAITLVLIDAEGPRAFCAGGDIAQMYSTGMAGDYDFGRQFWRDEYRLNAKIQVYPKPIISLMHGYTMGGGVGIGCHASHRVVCESSRIALPECSIGLVPDVGSSLLLAQAPGYLGEYIGLTGIRLGAGDAIHAGLADHYLPEMLWGAATEALTSGDPSDLTALCLQPPAPTLPQSEINAVFSADTLPEVHDRLAASPSGWAVAARKSLRAASPLSLACALQIIRAVRRDPTLQTALDHEYRFTSRALEHGDFLEGIRAQIIDKDQTPHWRSATPADIAAMRAPNPETCP